MSAVDEQRRLLASALYRSQPPTLDVERLRSTLAKRFGSVETVDTEADVAMFALDDLPAGDVEGEHVPCTVAFLSVDELDRETVQASLSQSWDWPEAGEVALSAVGSHVVLPTSWAWLDYKTRLDLLHCGISGLLDQSDPLALHWPQSQRIVAPYAYRQARAEGANRLFPQANVRMFRIEEGQPGERFMDTLGLFSLGLPDLQIRFIGEEPSQIAAQLFTIALYVYEHGDVIKDGDTVQGVPASASWVCQHAASSVGPDRPVLELQTA